MIKNWSGVLPAQGAVVVVEDYGTLRDIIGEVISELGATCCAFDKADNALLHMLSMKEHCLLVIAHHGLPGRLDGSEFIRLVSQRWPGTPCILMSGFCLDESVRPLGVPFLKKPFTVDELILAISQLMQAEVPAYREGLPILQTRGLN